MGDGILASVLETLGQAGFPAEAAYPGRRHPALEETVAAAHIESVDTEKLTVTVEVTILSPAQLGGTACEMAALRAAAALRGMGAACVQSGCRFDGLARVYSVAIQAVFPETLKAEEWKTALGFRVSLDDTPLPCVRGFTAEKRTDWAASYTIGENTPAGMAPGRVIWNITLEERFPIGSGETAQSDDGFQLVVERASGKKERYLGCRWSTEKREFTSAGLMRLRTGYAMKMEES